MRHRALCALAFLLAAPAAGATPGGLGLVVEPVHASFEHSGSADVLGLASAGAARIGCGIGVERGPLQLAVLFGRSATRTDFGLLDGPTSRVERATTEFELRWAAPLRLGPIGVRAACGLGRLSLRHHPDSVRIVLSGSSYDVTLPPEHAWTRHVAAEVLHSLSGNQPGNAELAVRAAWRFYALDVATPAGNERRALVDAQIGIALRARVF